jgi:hypothetical protein
MTQSSDHPSASGFDKHWQDPKTIKLGQGFKKKHFSDSDLFWGRLGLC